MAIDWSRLNIDPVALQAQIDQLGEVGAGPEGLYRPVYGEAWIEAMDLLDGWFADAGLVRRRDPMGSLIGRVEGTAPERVVLVGSHVDTVRMGGRYDGALGVLAGLASVRALLSAFGPPRKTLEVIGLCEEEGSRFPAPFWGSRGICGRIGRDEADLLLDGEGVSIGEAMRAVGLTPERIPDAKRHDIDAFFELHIEQGPVLENEHVDLGIPHTITGLRQIRVTVSGRQDHAGTTPMDLRLDPVVATADMIGRIAAAARTRGRPAVATIGFIGVLPGAVNVVAQEVSFTVDTRHSDADLRRRLIADIEQTVDEVGRLHGVKTEITILTDHEPVPLDDSLRSVLRDAATEESLSYLEIASGAGHDSQVFAQHVPTAMVFVPSQSGRSHTPEEHTPIEQVIPGIRTLSRALHHLAYAK